MAAWLVVASTALLAVGALSSPVVASWCVKEGWVEHVSHGVLLAAAIAWLLVALRHRCILPVGVTLGLLLVLGEEIDWGDVYGWRLGATVVQALSGEKNVHNLWGGASYTLFALPFIVLFGVGLLPAQRRRALEGFVGPVLPTRAEGLACVALGTLAVLSPGVFPAMEPLFNEVFELGLYVLVLMVALRLLLEQPTPTHGPPE